jgi:MFS family permease
MKMCLIIASIGFVVDQIGLQYFIDFPIMTYLFLFIDGIMLGIFWPVISGVFTVIMSQENDELKKKKLNRYFGLSWNTGGLFGYLLSAFALFIITDLLLIFDLSLVYTIIGLLIAISFKEPKTSFGIKNMLEEESSNPNSNAKWSFPIYVPLLMSLLFALIMGANGVLYPIKSRQLIFTDFSAYVTSFIRLLIQTISISYSLGLPIKKLKKTIPFLMVIGMVSLFMLGFTVDLIACIIFSGILGMIIGFFHSFGFRLTINKNLENNNMKATTYFETILGINFWLGPIIGGILADISILLGYSTLAIVILLVLIFFVSVQKKIELD